MLPGVTVDVQAAGTRLDTVTDDTGTWRVDGCAGRSGELDVPVGELLDAAPRSRGRGPARTARTSCLPSVSPPTWWSPAAGRSATSPTWRIRARIWWVSPPRRARAPSPPSNWRRGPSCAPARVLEAVPGFIASQHSGEGKANQLLPARLQSGSRLRLRHHSRRRADERVVRRACPRVQRRESAHSRARQRRAVHQGTVLRRARRLLGGRVGQHQLRERARSPIAERQQRRARGGGACSVRSRRKWARATC